MPQGVLMQKLIFAFEKIILPALGQTLYMSLASTFLALLIALPWAVLLSGSGKNGLFANAKLYSVIDFFTNVLRSFPFIILIIILIPFTRFLIGKSIGTTATIIPLTIGIAPYLAKMIESTFKEVDLSVIEAAKSYGASNLQIITKIYLSEALPSIIEGVILTLIIVIGFSAMAGTVGGGGLGDVAIRYGYERFRKDIMLETIIVLIILVQLVQFVGNLVYKSSKKGKR